MTPFRRRESPPLIRVLSGPIGVLVLSAPAYACLFFIYLLNSLSPLMAGQVPPDLGSGADGSRTLQFLQILCLTYLFLIYGLALWHWRRLNVSARALGWSAAAITILAWTLLPADSSDVLDYIGFGRLIAVYHVSPYLHTYAEFTDRFSTYVTWDEPMPYGPIVLPVYALAGALSQRHVVMAIYAIKFMWALCHLLNGWLIYRLARWLTPVPEYAFFLFVFNPLILLEQPGNGHNDGLLILFGLLALYALQHKREGLAIWLAFLGALVKTSGLIWLAGIATLLIGQRRWRGLGRGSAAVLAGCACIVTLFPGAWTVFTSMDAQWQYSEDSLHTLLIDRIGALGLMFSRTWGYADMFWVDRLIASSLFLAACAWRLTAIRDVVSFVREIGYVLSLLLLIFAVSVHPWYMVWLLPIAALTDSAELRRTITVASGAALALYAFPSALLQHGNHRLFWSALRLSVAFEVPIGFWAWELITLA